jgi:glycosyltransferase involved in cell wall biosynthesis
VTDLTAIILTHNEERHLPDCLATLTWADERLVLDSGSTDRTVTIAREAGARIATHRFENYGRQRQHALTLATTSWVLFVDADERIPAPLATAIRDAIASEDAAAYWIARENYFWGHRLHGGGWWPDYQLRLLEVARCAYDPDQAVHEVARVDGPTAQLAPPMIHLNYDDLGEFRAKQRAYAELEAERRHAGGYWVRPRNLLLQPLREFRRRYVTLGGWRDGPTGLLLCSLMAWYELVTLQRVARLGPRTRR